MDRTSRFIESLSRMLRSQGQREQPQTISALRWLAIVSLFLFLALLMAGLVSNNTQQALVLAIGIVPILVSLLYIRQGKISLAGAILAINLIVLITWLTTNGNGVYDAGIIAFPVVLLIASLIFTERFIAYLTVLIILCIGWLVFGDIWNLYEPQYPLASEARDFFIITVIVLVAGNSINLLVRNVYQTLEHAQQEIEARKRAEHEREQLIYELKAKNQELNRFAITVSHDLKTPLITISGYLGYLERDILDGNHQRMQKDLSQINDAAKRMGRFVDQILDLSRVGRIIYPPTEVAFGAIVEEALTVAQGPIETRKVRLQIEPGLPIVSVDRVRMVQVMQNLITNSIKFMGQQESPQIEIGTFKREGTSGFFVKDNGIGIDPKHQGGIFELFNQLDAASEGSGIGLSLVKRIIEVHGGQIWVESELGKGATFFFTLGQETV
jgi:signal transduction histidine kinase